MSEGRVPITEVERPHLEALGRTLRGLRLEAGMTQEQVGALASLRGSSLSAIERGQRRTRRSTLERLVTAMLPEQRRAAVLDELVDAAGPGLAPESDYAESVARRRAGRERRAAPGAIEAMRELLASAQRAARTHPAGHPRHEWATEQVTQITEQLARMEAAAVALGASLPPARRRRRRSRW